MADNIRVIDCRVDELAANMNALRDHYMALVWNFYETDLGRRVTVVLSRMEAAPVPLPSGFDPRRILKN